MMLSKSELSELYAKRARNYDKSANLYYLAGFREDYYRSKAVQQLDLQPGDTVVEIGCGTGLNFRHIQEYIGPTGRIIGVDMTADMLSIAKQRCSQNNLTNVELVEQDATKYLFSTTVDGVISSFALTLMPQYQEIIRHIYDALLPGKKFILLDLKLPNWPLPLIKIAVFFTRPFGVSIEMGDRHPWETMREVFGNLNMMELYFGAAFIAKSVKH